MWYYRTKRKAKPKSKTKTKRSTAAFGQTWWGKTWLDAMERVGSNRLPRGKSYARNGSVQDVQIQQNQVAAKVQGSRSYPYSVTFSFKPFSAEEKLKIKAMVSEDPSLAAKLSLGELPQNLFARMEEEKLPLFPRRWGEMMSSCSCPDYADPCKHQAAVCYILAGEIDKDPFLVFNLRGISREELSADLKVKAGEAARKALYRPAEEVGLYTPDLSAPTPLLNFPPVELQGLFRLLSPKPLFYPHGDFKPLLLNGYKALIQEVNRLEVDEEGHFPFESTHLYWLERSPQSRLTSNFRDSSVRYGGRCFFAMVAETQEEAGETGAARKLNLASRQTEVFCKVPVVRKDQYRCVRKKGLLLPLDDLLARLMVLPLETGSATSSAAYFSLAVSTALALVGAGAFLPRVLAGEGGFRIGYVPLAHHPSIQQALSELKDRMPANLAFREKDQSLLDRNEADELFAEILTVIIHLLAGRSGNAKTTSSPEEQMIRTFFRGDWYPAEDFKERHTANGISSWLEPIHLRQRSIVPVLSLQPFETEGNFQAEASLENREDPMAPLVPLAKLFQNRGKIFAKPTSKLRPELLRQMAIAGDHLPPVMEILKNQGKSPARVSSEELISLLSEGASLLNLLGIRLILPKELARLASPRAAVKGEMKGKGELSWFNLESMMEFSWEIALGDQTLSAQEFRTLVKSAGKIVRFRDQYLLLKPEEVKSILEKIKGPPPGPASMEILRSALLGEMAGVPFLAGRPLERLVEELSRTEETGLPSTLTATLRPYQERGFRWLWSNTVKGLGSCIADDMGLGKTIQVIALALKMKEEKRLKSPVLVIAPTTLVGNWQKECQRFGPSLEVLVYHGNERSLQMKGMDLIITTYGILRRDLEKFQKKEWGLIIIDEAQNIKNPATDQTRAVKALKGAARIAMSGTPVENRLMELWSIFDFINQGYLGSAEGFRREFATPIEKYSDRDRAERLRKVAAPFLLRRLKTDKSIIGDLPDKIMFDEYCYLTPEQTALYQRVLEESLKVIEGSGGISRKGLIFKMITSLKQICNHPAHFSKKGAPDKILSGKAERLMELSEQILARKEKSLIFTQYTEMGELLQEMFRTHLKEEAHFFHGGLSRTKREAMVENFQENDKTRLMILSLKAGGTGLNLTAASNVIHYDLWWNPAVEAQATDRAYRIGQQSNVTVHRLITLGTFEEKIDEMIRAKKELADLTVSAGEQWITEMSDRQIRELFSLNVT